MLVSVSLSIFKEFKQREMGLRAKKVQPKDITIQPKLLKVKEVIIINKA